MSKLRGQEFFTSIGRPTFVVAPMVEQSELPFRLLARRYGAQLCYTPMLHSQKMTIAPKYRANNFHTCAEDRPLIAQLAGDNKHTLLEAAKHVQDSCDAVDLNLGCPQGIARRGHYGSFLLEEKDLLVDIVSHLDANLKVPVTCKIRLLPKLEDTLTLVRALEAAGCSILTVHGRTKEQNKDWSGICDWDAIKAVKEVLKIPVFANGGIGSLADVRRCMEYTGVDGVMSSEAVLSNPALFVDRVHPETGKLVSQAELALEYADIYEKHPMARPKALRTHMFKFLFDAVQKDLKVRDLLVVKGFGLEDARKAVRYVLEHHKDVDDATRTAGVTTEAVALCPDLRPGLVQGAAVSAGDSWYCRHWDKETGRPKPVQPRGQHLPPPHTLPGDKPLTAVVEPPPAKRVRTEGPEPVPQPAAGAGCSAAASPL